MMAMEKKGKILIVDDNEDVLLSLNMLLKPYVEGIRVINTPERIIGMMDSFMPEVIMLDMNFHRDAISGEEGYEWLEKILAATNAHLREKVGEGTFRQDLFYRLNTIELHLPPLRERGEDIVLLAEYFLKIYSGKYSVGDVRLGASAKQKLLKHNWPGNVRELQHCIERAIVLGDKTELAAEDIRLEDSVAVSGSSSSVNIDSLNLQTLEREATS